jgi:hypothetical protein
LHPIPTDCFHHSGHIHSGDDGIHSLLARAASQNLLAGRVLLVADGKNPGGASVEAANVGNDGDVCNVSDVRDVSDVNNVRDVCDVSDVNNVRDVCDVNNVRDVCDVSGCAGPGRIVLKL